MVPVWPRPIGQTTASLRKVAEEVWAGGGSLDVELVGQSQGDFDFNVTRCGYAEFYKEMGLPDLGFRMHCNRDHAMLGSFNSDFELSRTQTIMEGAVCCNFRYRKKT